MDIEHDRDADALYVSLNDEPYAYGEDLDLRRGKPYCAATGSTLHLR